MKKYFLIIVFFSFYAYTQNVLGIDVSHHQGVINWSLVANDGKVFAFVKATEGYTYDDPRFIDNMNNGINAGVIMGAYHFARPDNNSAVDEADHFVSVAGNYIGNGFLPPVLDLEDPNSNTHLDQLFSSQALTNWVQNWMNRVEILTGVKPIIYLNSHYANYLNSSLNVYKLWIAKPGTAPNTPPNDIGNWTDWEFKQYSWAGSVNGISGDVDLNSYNGSTSDFNYMIQHLNISDNSAGEIKLYPNPIRNKLYFIYKENIFIQKVFLFDINGRHLLTTELQDDYIDLTNFETGIYFLQIETERGDTFIYKIIKN